MSINLFETLRCWWAAGCICILLTACSSSSVSPADGDTIADGDGTEVEENDVTEEPEETDSEPDLDMDEDASEETTDTSDGDDAEDTEGEEDSVIDGDIPEDPEDCLVGQRVTVTLPPEVRPQQCSPNEGMVHWVSFPGTLGVSPRLMQGADSFWCFFAFPEFLWCKLDDEPQGSIAQLVFPRVIDTTARMIALLPEDRVVFALSDNGRLFRWKVPDTTVDVTDTLHVPVLPDGDQWSALVVDRAVSGKHPVLIQPEGAWYNKDGEWFYAPFPVPYEYGGNFSLPGGELVLRVAIPGVGGGFRYLSWDADASSYTGNIVIDNNGITSVNLLMNGMEFLERELVSETGEYTNWVVVYGDDGSIISRTQLILEGMPVDAPLWFYGLFKNQATGEVVRRYAVTGRNDKYVWYNDGDRWRAKSFIPEMEDLPGYWSFSIGANGSLYAMNSSRVYAFSLDNQWTFRHPGFSLNSGTDVWVSPDSSAWVSSSGHPVMRLVDGCILETMTCRPLGRQSVMVKSSISGWNADDVIVSAQEEDWVWRMQGGVWRHLIKPEFSSFASELAAGGPGYATIFTDHERTLIYTWNETSVERYLAEGTSGSTGGSGPLGSVMRGSDQVFYHDIYNTGDPFGLFFSEGQFTSLLQIIPCNEVWDILRYGDEVLVFDGDVVHRLDENLNLIDPPWNVDIGELTGYSVAMGEDGPELLLDRSGNLWFLSPGNAPENMYVSFPGSRFIRKLAAYEYIIWGPDGTVVRFVLPDDYRE